MNQRAFVRHVIYGTIYAIESGDGGVVAAAIVTDTTACRHRLGEYALSLDVADDIHQHAKDYEPFEPPCSDARHWLADIGAACKEADQAERDRKSVV